MIAALRAGFAAQAERLGKEAVAGAAAGLEARIAAQAPEIGIEISDAQVRLSSPDLRLRAFGSRKRAADPQLLAMVGGRP